MDVLFAELNFEALQNFGVNLHTNLLGRAVNDFWRQIDLGSYLLKWKVKAFGVCIDKRLGNFLAVRFVTPIVLQLNVQIQTALAAI